MKPGMKMMLMERARQGNEESRSEYGGNTNRRMIGYDRDRREPGMANNNGGAQGRAQPEMAYRNAYGNTQPEMAYGNNGGGGAYGNGYGNGGGGNAYGAQNFYPRYETGNVYPPYGREPEARRRRDGRGRYAMGGSEYEEDEEEEEHRHHGKEAKGDKMTSAPMWNESKDRQKSQSMKPVNERQAMEWVEGMEASNGKTMPVFKPDYTDNFCESLCPECNKWEFFVVMNAMYADYQPAAVKFNADKPEFYAYMAKGFIEDPDAEDHKLQRYMEHIAKK